MNKLISDLVNISKEAGKEILDVYNSFISVEYKEDKTPLTEADKRSHKVIVEGIKRISEYPVLSEEGKSIPYEERKNWEYFWMVDPLDGTKEFIKKNGEFTVNIALIHNKKPILGIVYAPAIDTLYYGGNDIGAYKIQNDKIIDLNSVKQTRNDPKSITVVASKSHLNEETKEFIKMLEKFYDDVKTASIGSSLKICLLAEKKADIYPRIAPTMEWDTAAAHAILNAADGKMIKYEKVSDLKKLENLPELEYNKENLLNPYFVAIRSDVF
ncbi:3'(2'),5'-bisphosphate nucleotidase CysQ [Persephonella sp.]